MKINIISKIYDYILSYSKKESSRWTLAFISFADSSFFFIPPDFLLLPMCLANYKKSFSFALNAMVFSTLGGIFGYYIGYFFYGFIGEHLINFFHYQDKFDYLSRLYHKYSIIVIFIGGFTPFPYKVVSIFSGAVHVNIYLFILMSAFSRGLRFFIIATIVYFFEDKANAFIKKHISTITVLVAAILVLLYLLYIIF